MTNPTSSHPKIIVSEYTRTSTDSMQRTTSDDSRRTSTSLHPHAQSHNSQQYDSHSALHENDEDSHPGMRVNASHMHENKFNDDHGKVEGWEGDIETVKSMGEERRKRKRDYALQLSKAMGRQLVSGISKGSKAEAKEKVQQAERAGPI